MIRALATASSPRTLARSLPLQVAALVGSAVLLATLMIALLSYVMSQRTISQDTYRKLGSLASLQANALEAHFQGLGQVLVTATQMPELRSAARPMADAFASLRQHKDSEVARATGVAAPDALERGDYGRWQARLQPVFKSLGEKFGFGDFYLVDPRSDTVYYSYARAADFATSLATGPWAASGLAEASRMALRQKSGEVWLSDFRPYKPAAEEQVAFMAEALVEGGEVQAVLVARVPIDRINQIMNLSGRWKQAGLGQSGETVLVAPDGGLRSVSRGWLTQSPGYLKQLGSFGPELAAQLKVHDSDVGLVSMPAPLVAAMAQETAGSGIFEVQGRKQLVAFTPARLLNRNVQVLAKISSAEVFAALGRQVWPMLAVGAVAALVLAALAAWLVAGLERRPAAPPEAAALRRAPDEFADNDRLSAPLTPRIENLLARALQSAPPESNSPAALQGAVRNLIRSLGGLTPEGLPPSVGESALPVEDALGAAIADALKLLTGETCKVLHAVGQISSDLALTTMALQRKAAPATPPGGEAEAEVLARMHGLQERSLELAQGVEILQGLSERTALLALNASMHAAAAGEAGRRFALVGIEVKRLAQSARSATALIVRLVSSFQGPGGQSDLDMIGKVQEISRLAGQVEVEMRRTQEDALKLSERIHQLSQGPDAAVRGKSAGLHGGDGIRDATLETLRQLQSQASETKRLVDYAKTLLHEVQVHKTPE